MAAISLMDFVVEPNQGIHLKGNARFVNMLL